MVCEANGLVGAARDAYANAAAIQASEAKWWFHLAAVEARLGKLDDAVRDMRRAIELNPTYAPAHWRLGLWLLDQNQTRRRGARVRPRDRDRCRPIERGGSAWRACTCSGTRRRARRGLLERAGRIRRGRAVHAATAGHGLSSARPCRRSGVGARRSARGANRSGPIRGPTRCSAFAAATPHCSKTRPRISSPASFRRRFASWSSSAARSRTISC